jgi:hypothetical protein
LRLGGAPRRRRQPNQLFEPTTAAPRKTVFARHPVSLVRRLGFAITGGHSSATATRVSAAPSATASTRRRAPRELREGGHPPSLIDVRADHLVVGGHGKQVHFSRRAGWLGTDVLGRGLELGCRTRRPSRSEFRDVRARRRLAGAKPVGCQNWRPTCKTRPSRGASRILAPHGAWARKSRRSGQSVGASRSRVGRRRDPNLPRLRAIGATSGHARNSRARRGWFRFALRGGGLSRR